VFERIENLENLYLEKYGQKPDQHIKKRNVVIDNKNLEDLLDDIKFVALDALLMSEYAIKRSFVLGNYESSTITTMNESRKNIVNNLKSMGVSDNSCEFLNSDLRRMIKAIRQARNAK